MFSREVSVPQDKLNLPNPVSRPEVFERIDLSPDVGCLTLRLTGLRANTRILYSKSSLQGVVVDPAGEGEKILFQINELNIKTDEIWLTHSHPDHYGGAWQIKEEADDVRLIASMHPKERIMRRKMDLFLATCNQPNEGMKNCPSIDQSLTAGSLHKVGDLEFIAIETPGHSPGHFSFYSAAAKILLCGDLVFKSSSDPSLETQFAPTHIWGADPKVFFETLSMLKDTIPHDVLCLSGHGRSFHMSDWDLPTQP